MNKKLKPVLVVLSGLIGSGKSTFAKELTRQKQYLRVSSDALRVELFGLKNYDFNDNKKLFEEMDLRLIRLLSAGKNVIADANHNSSKIWDQKQQLANQVNANCFFVLLQAPEHIIKQRLQQRVVHDLPLNLWQEDQLDVLKKSLKYNQQSSDSRFIKIDSTLTPEQQVAIFIEKMSAKNTSR